MSILSKGLSTLVLLALFAVPAVAQDMGQQEPPPPAEVDLSEDEKEAVAHAYVSVEMIRAEYQDEFADIEDPDEAQNIQQQFQEEVNEAIEEEGITLELYDQAIQATQTDAELRDDLLARIDEIREEEGAPQPEPQPEPQE